MRSKSKSQLKSLGDIILKVAPKLGIDRKLPGFLLHTRWPEIVGEKVAEHTCPLELKRGKLIVLASSSVWLNELHYLKSLILKTIQEKEPDFMIKDIVFKLGSEEKMRQLREMVKK